MAEQLLDLRQGLGALRRHRLALVGVALIGAAAGVTYSSLHAPSYTSTSQVLLPQLEVSGQLANRDPATEVRIASSGVVLGAAGKTLDPPMSGSALAHHVSVSAPGTDVVQYTVTSHDADLATAIADAAAKAEVAYVQEAGTSVSAAQRTSLDSRKKTLNDTLTQVTDEYDAAVARIKKETGAQQAADLTVKANLTTQMSDLAGRLDNIAEEEQGLAAYAGDGANGGARIIEPATAATPPNAVTEGALLGLGGAGLAVVLLVLLLMIRAGRDKRLRLRDAIADACGSTVVATVRSRVPRTVNGWTGLLSGYKPVPSDAWALRQVLRHALGQPGQRAEGPTRLAMLTLADDAAGLAVAVQTASYAASTGLHTRLVAADQRPDSATALWAALRQADGGELRPGLEVGGGPAELTVSLAVLDRTEPTLGDAVEDGNPDAVVLVLSSGTATADELARAAMAADDAGIPIAGVVVADPDELDHTTGRMPQRERTEVPELPTRLTGVSSLSLRTDRRGAAR